MVLHYGFSWITAIVVTGSIGQDTTKESRSFSSSSIPSAASVIDTGAKTRSAQEHTFEARGQIRVETAALNPGTSKLSTGSGSCPSHYFGIKVTPAKSRLKGKQKQILTLITSRTCQNSSFTFSFPEWMGQKSTLLFTTKMVQSHKVTKVRNGFQEVRYQV